MLDIVGNRSWRDCRRVLKPGGIFVVAGAQPTNRWIGPLGHVAALRIASLFGSRKVVNFMAKISAEDLDHLGQLLQAGTVTPVIDRTYDRSQIVEALEYLGQGHARGKVVISV